MLKLHLEHSLTKVLTNNAGSSKFLHVMYIKRDLKVLTMLFFFKTLFLIFGYKTFTFCLGFKLWNIKFIEKLYIQMRHSVALLSKVQTKNKYTIEDTKNAM